MQRTDYELVIIGGGPAGLTAGIYASRARLNTVLLEKVVLGGQVLVTDLLENYPGFPKPISGPDLVSKMAEQAKNFGLKIDNEEVLSVDFSDKIKKIRLNGKIVTTLAVIIASGAHPKKLNVPGEGHFYGRGVSTCATCDAPFYKDRIVAAVGGGDTAVQESLFLTKFVKKVYLIHRRDELRATKILQDRAFENDKIKILWDSVVKSLEGTKELKKVVVENVKTGKSKDLLVDGCFTWIGILPNTDFIEGSLKLDEHGFIITDSNMEASVPGVFVAGDVRSKSLRQIVTAAGDAATAAVAANHYIENFYE